MASVPPLPQLSETALQGLSLAGMQQFFGEYFLAQSMGQTLAASVPGPASVVLGALPMAMVVERANSGLVYEKQAPIGGDTGGDIGADTGGDTGGATGGRLKT